MATSISSTPPLPREARTDGARECQPALATVRTGCASCSSVAFGNASQNSGIALSSARKTKIAELCILRTLADENVLRIDAKRGP